MNTYDNHLETLDMTVLQDSKEIGTEMAHNNCMKSRSRDGLAAKGLLEILKVCRILIMLMVGRQCNIQNKRASVS